MTATSLALALLGGCGGGQPSPHGSSADRPASSPSSRTPAAAALPLDAAIGQLFAVSFSGPAVTPGLRHLILDEKVGTVLLFSSNAAGPGDLAPLTAELRALGRQAGLPAPLLVTLDQEGGGVRQVRDGIPYLPSEHDLASQGPAAVEEATAVTAAALRSLGVGLDLAPVADLRTNPEDLVIEGRSFGSDPARVAPLVAAAVRGLHRGGVGAAVKHFPGLGGASGDPHRALPADPVGLAQWTSTQRRGFAAGIAAGADCVMTTALAAPGLDPSGTPALFSRPVVTGLLRDGLRFGGVIVTDSLSLGGLGPRYPLPVASLAALAAGNDLLLLSNGDPAYEAQAVDAVRQAVAVGRVSPERVRESAARVIALSRRWAPPT